MPLNYSKNTAKSKSNKKAKKSKTLKIAIVCIGFLFFFVLAPFIATIIVCNSIFCRYDGSVAFASETATFAATRELYTFSSGSCTLQGYFYPALSSDDEGLVIVVPGLHAGGDDYIEVAKTFAENGYAVFTFDPTGVDQSEGTSEKSFSQGIYDLEAALDYLQDNQYFGYQNVWLFGHSRGAYSACCILDEGYANDIDGVIAVSGINSAMDAIMGASVHTVGTIAYANYPFLWLYQGLCSDFTVLNDSAVSSISASNVPVLIIQGNEDQNYTPTGYSLYCHADEITNTNYKTYLITKNGQDDHTSLMYDSDGSSSDDMMTVIFDFMDL